MRLLTEPRRAACAPAARSLVCATALFLIIFTAHYASAATFTVNTTADTVDATAGDGICADAGALCSLRAAISEANALAGSDVITLPAGTYTTTIATTNENVNANGDFDITSNITINGAGSGGTIVQANAAANTATDRVFDINGAAGVAIINDVTVRNGQVTTTAERGGGIRVISGSLSLNNSIVTANRAFSSAAAQVIGGGIYNEVGGLTLNNVDVTANACSTTGTSCLTGGIYNIGSATAVVNITNSRVTNNTTTSTGTNASAAGAGFATQSGGTINITGSTFTGNTANGTGTSGGSGAGLRFSGSATVNTTVTVTDSTVSNNTVGATGSGNSGGGILFVLATSTTNTFTSTLTNVTINGNTATSSGGGVAISGATGTNTFNNCRITNNRVSATTGSAFGGGVSMNNVSTLNFNNSVISGNTANTTSTVVGTSSNGGGINYQDGTINFTDTAISGNSAANGGGLRAAAFSTGTTATATFNRSSVTGNTATDGGGIIFFSNGTTNGVLNLNNSTVGNNTSNSASGIEIFNFAAGNITANVSYSTIAGNTATGQSGGAANFGQQTAGATGVGTFNLASSVVANNSGSSSPDILGVITSLGYNLVENTSGGTFGDTGVPAFTAATGDQTGVDPMLGPLANNGNRALSYRPLPGSVLIDQIPTGVNQCGTAPFNVDQRGLNRPIDSDGNGAAACEKGSIEVNAVPTAAEVSIGGRVLTAQGRGIRGVSVTLTDASGNLRRATTSAFGRYRFDGVGAGATYVITAKGKRFSFSQPSQVLNASEDVGDIDFTANPVF